MSRTRKKSGGATWVLGGLVTVLVLLAGAYVAAYFVAGNRVPENSVVEGVRIGGLTPAGAAEKLRAELEPSYAQPVTVADADGNTAAIKPLESGYQLDYESTVRSSGGGFSWNPVDIVNAFRGGGPVDLVTRLDEAQLRSVVAAQADTFLRDAKDATLAFNPDGTIQRTESQTSRALDVDQTVEKVKTAFETRAPKVEAVLSEKEPSVTTAMVDEAVKSFAEPAISGPVTVKVGDQSFEVTPAQIAAATTMGFEGGQFKHSLDGGKLLAATGPARSKLTQGKPRDASYKWGAGGSIEVVPSVDGKTLDEPAMVKAVEGALSKKGAERVVTASTTAQKATFTTQKATQLKPREVIGEFTTQYPHASYRNKNLSKAATTINGSVLLPGETFSLNDTLGQRTAKNGYVDGYVINSGVLVKESGGGISQSATTLFNAAFFAGYEDVEHKPHSLYFPRYPAGREATVYYGKVDLRFKNNTQYPAIIQGYVNPSSSGKKGSITFKIWSIKTWEKVTSTELKKSDFYSGDTRVLDTPGCEPQGSIQGFTVTWQRQFWKGGKVVRSEPFKWQYDAGDRITCK